MAPHTWLGPVGSIALVGKPFEKVGIDIIGTFEPKPIVTTLY